jgi:hypothetical protein
MKMTQVPVPEEKHEGSSGKKGCSADTWAAIASPVAALFSMILLFYQLHTDNPNLRIDLSGAALAAYFCFGSFERFRVALRKK